MLDKVLATRLNIDFLFWVSRRGRRAALETFSTTGVGEVRSVADDSTAWVQHSWYHFSEKVVRLAHANDASWLMHSCKSTAIKGWLPQLLGQLGIFDLSHFSRVDAVLTRHLSEQLTTPAGPILGIGCAFLTKRRHYPLDVVFAGLCWLHLTEEHQQDLDAFRLRRWRCRGHCRGRRPSVPGHFGTAAQLCLVSLSR